MNARKHVPITGDTAGSRYNTVRAVVIRDTSNANINLINVILFLWDMVVVGLFLGLELYRLVVVFDN